MTSKLETGIMYICHGAEHEVQIAATEDSPWVNQQASLNTDSAEPDLPVTTNPEIGVYKTFSEEGFLCTINCPPQSAETPVQALQLRLQSEFTAAPYKLDFSLGHHRLAYVDATGHEQFQVIEFDEGAILNARQVSHYTSQAIPFEGQWKLRDEILGPSKPENDGQVSQAFKRGTAGSYPVRVVVPSLYYEVGYAYQEFNVTFLALTPWGNNATLQINSKPVTDVSKLGVICTRGQSNTLKLLNPDLLLEESTLILSSASDLAKLGVTIEYLDVARPLVGAEISWPIISSASTGKSGWFELGLSCSKLKKDWENISARVISANLADEVTAINVRERPISDVGALFFPEETVPLELTFEPWMLGLRVALKEEGADKLGIKANPPFEQYIEVTESLKLSWDVTSGANTGSFKFLAVCEDTTTALTVDSRVISKISAGAFKAIKLNGVDIADLNKPDFVVFREDVNQLELEANPQGPLPGMKVALMPGNLHPDLGNIYDPPLSEANAQTIPANGSVKWTITAGNKSGFFDLLFKFTETDEVFPLPWRLLSKNLAEEVDVEIAGAPVPEAGNVFIRGIGQKLILKPKLGSPLGDHPVTLTCCVKTGLDPANVTSSPKFNEPQDAHNWTVTGATKSGTFELVLTGQDMATPIILATSKLLSNDLAEEVDVEIDGAPVPEAGNVFIRGIGQKLILKPKPDSPLGDHPVTLTCCVKTGLDPANVTSSPKFNEPQDAHNWTVTGATKSGTFELVLTGQDMATPIILATSKLLSNDLADEVDMTVDDDSVPLEGAVFLRGQGRTLSLKPKSSSPIDGVQLQLRYVAGGNLPETDLKSQPGFRSPTADYNWEITGPDSKSGTFNVEVAYGEQAKTAVMKGFVLSKNLEDELAEISITPAGGSATPVDLEGEGIALSKDSARLTIRPLATSPLKGRVVSFKWVQGANPSVAITPTEFKVVDSTAVEFVGLDNPAAQKKHLLSLDYGGQVSEPWEFRYFRGPHSAGLKIMSGGVDHGAFPILLKFNVSKEISIVPKAEDGVFVGWKCKFVDVKEPGVDIELLPPLDEFMNIESPGSGGAKRTIRARDTEGFDYRRVYMEVLLKGLEPLRIPIEIDQLESGNDGLSPLAD